MTCSQIDHSWCILASVSPTPDVPGYEMRDGWLIESKRTQDIAAMEVPPPRSYGVLDQLKVDLLTRRTQILYAVIAGTFVVAGALASLWLALIGVALILFFGRGFLTGIRLGRHGITGVARISQVQHAFGDFGMTENIEVEGSRRNVGYQLAPVNAILDAGYDVELRVIYVPNSRDPADAFAYRAGKRSLSVPWEES